MSKEIKYTKKGLINRLLNYDETGRKIKEEDGKWDEEYKYVFEYTDTEISPARYASMINYFLLEGGGNYYIFNWF